MDAPLVGLGAHEVELAEQHDVCQAELSHRARPASERLVLLSLLLVLLAPASSAMLRGPPPPPSSSSSSSLPLTLRPLHAIVIVIIICRRADGLASRATAARPTVHHEASTSGEAALQTSQRSARRADLAEAARLDDDGVELAAAVLRGAPRAQLPGSPESPRTLQQTQPVGIVKTAASACWRTMSSSSQARSRIRATQRTVLPVQVVERVVFPAPRKP